MDIEPTRHQQIWRVGHLAGSVGNVIGPWLLVRSHCIKVGELLLTLAMLTVLLGMLWKQSITTPTSSHIDQSMQGFKAGILNVLKLKTASSTPLVDVATIFRFDVGCFCVAFGTVLCGCHWCK